MREMKCRRFYVTCIPMCAVLLIFSVLWECALRVQARDAAAKVLVPEAPGRQAAYSGDAALDYSNVSSGYVMLKYSGSNQKVRFRITTPTGTAYTYSVSGDGDYMAYPLSGGDGKYVFAVYESVSAQDNLYAVILSKNVQVVVKDSFSPFLYPNYYVNFSDSSACVGKASEIAKDCAKDLDVVSAVYHYETQHITYDDDKAKTVKPGYAPYPDNTLASGKGICFDYASLMAAMLRSQGIPTKLEVGYVGDLYHAWISCHISDVGWVDGIIRFDGTNWIMMDPTMAAGQKPKDVKNFLKENNYVVKYSY